MRGLKLAYQNDLYPRMLVLPSPHKDVDEWANVAPSPEALEECFSGAQDAFTGIAQRTVRDYDMQSPVERKRFLQSMFDMLVFVQDWTVLSRYLEQLSTLTHISYDLLFGQFKTYSKSQTTILATVRKEQATASQPVKEDDTRLFHAFFA
jgi:hypothetical protein